MSKPISREITVKGRSVVSDDREIGHEVEALVYSDRFAVHTAIDADGWWTVSHVQHGRVVAHVKALKAAHKLARWLEKHHLADDDAAWLDREHNLSLKRAAVAAGVAPEQWQVGQS